MRPTLQSFLAVGALVAGIAGTGSSAQAGLTIAPLIGGGPGVGAGTTYENFDDVPLGWNSGLLVARPNGLSITFSNGVTNDTGQAVKGDLGGVYAAPFVQGTSGTLFGNVPANAKDNTTYLTTGKTATLGPPPTGGSVTLNFATGQNYFGLLWGSVDAYNSLYFYDGATLIGTVTGSDVSASPNGNQGVNGSPYVNITSTDAFTKVIAASSNFAFEFDNVAFNNSTFLTPEPSTALMGLIAVGFVGLRRRMKKATSAV